MKIIIAGAGAVGSYLAGMLTSESSGDVTVIDQDQSRLEAVCENTDVLSVCGSPTSIETLRKAGVANADLFIAVNPSTSQNVNIVSALLAKSLGCRRVTARVNNEEYLHYDNRAIFTDLGIDMLFYPERIAAGEIADLLQRTASSESLDFAGGRIQLVVFKVEEDSPLIDMKLLDFSHEVKEDFRVVAVSRGEESLIPGPQFKFRYLDRVYLIATREGTAPILEYLGKKDRKVDKVMIFGGGAIGEMLTEQIRGRVCRIKIFEEDRELCRALSERINSDKVTIVNGDGRDTDLLLEERIREYDAFVAVTPSTETNILACAAAKRLGVGRTVAEVENIDYQRLAEEMGVDAMINRKLITAGRIFKLTLSDRVRSIKYMNGSSTEILEYVIGAESTVVGKTLNHIQFPEGAVVGGVIRGRDAFIAVGSTELKAYDRVIVFALPGSVGAVDRLFS